MKKFRQKTPCELAPATAIRVKQWWGYQTIDNRRSCFTEAYQKVVKSPAQFVDIWDQIWVQWWHSVPGALLPLHIHEPQGQHWQRGIKWHEKSYPQDCSASLTWETKSMFWSLRTSSLDFFTIFCELCLDSLIHAGDLLDGHNAKSALICNLKTLDWISSGRFSSFGGLCLFMCLSSLPTTTSCLNSSSLEIWHYNSSGSSTN